MAYIDNVTNILQIQPDGLPTFVRLSQNENGRNLYFQLAGNEIDIPANATVVIEGTKPDGTVYSGTGSISDNVILIPEMIQMTAVAGFWDAKVKIISGGNTVATGRIRFVIDADTVEPGSVPSDSVLDGLVAEAQQYAETARTEAYGSPLTATTAAGMTDRTRVYVYTGSESGYTAGHWYYWNGSAWADGGVYNSTAVNTDTTLTLRGEPADAYVTGLRIKGVQADIDEISHNTVNLANAYRMAGNDVTVDDGVLSGSASAFASEFALSNGGLFPWISSADYGSDRYTLSFRAKNDTHAATTTGLEAAIFYTDASSDVLSLPNNTADWTDFSITSAAGKSIAAFLMRAVSETGYVWHIDQIQLVKGTAVTDYTPSRVLDTDPTLTISGKAADAKVTGDEITQLKGDLTNIEQEIDEISERGISAVGASAGQVPVADGNDGWEWKINGDYQVAKNQAELTGTIADKVLVLQNDSDYGNGGMCWFENQGDQRRSLGYVRENGTRVYPMPKTAPEPTTPPYKQIMGYVKSWVGRTNIIHHDNSVIDNTSLFGPDCEADSNGYFHMNCSDFVGAVLLGISYERSRYVRGKTAENICDTTFTQYKIPQSVESQKEIGGLSTREWAQWFAENGRLYKSPQTPEELANILQVGDVVFFSTENAQDAITSYYALSHCAICLGCVMSSAAVSEPDPYGHPYIILAQCTSDASGGNEGTAVQIRAYDIANWINIFKLFARPDYMHYNSFSPKMKSGNLVLNDVDIEFIPMAEGYLDNSSTYKSYANQLYYSTRWSTSLNYIPVIPGSIVEYTGIRTAERCSYNIRMLEYDEYFNATTRGSTLVYQGGTPAQITLNQATKYVRFCVGVPSGYKIRLHDTDGFEVTIKPPTE